MPTTKPARAAASDLLRRVGRGLARLERERICCGEVTRQQFDTLRALDAADGLTTSELARRFGIDLSTASRNLAVLEREGCLRRRAGRDDARQVRILVTAKGRACLASLCCEEDATFEGVLGRLPQRERGRVLRALGLLAEALDGACGAEACCPPARTRPAPRLQESTR